MQGFPEIELVRVPPVGHEPIVSVKGISGEILSFLTEGGFTHAKWSEGKKEEGALEVSKSEMGPAGLEWVVFQGKVPKSGRYCTFKKVEKTQ
jgi:hypothetical protein